MATAQVLPTMSEAFFMGCDAENIKIDCVPGRGRVIRACRDTNPDEQIMMAPLELQVSIPEADGDSPEEKDFAVVADACKTIGNIHGSDTYWSALQSLTEDQGPEDGRWPCISAQMQARLLLLFRPEFLSSSCDGRCLVETPAAEIPAHGPQELPRRSARTAPTRDLVAERLCEHFGLRLSPSALEDLVLVWKYNSFCILPSPGYPAALEIYVAAALFSHSCNPNTWWEHSETGDFTLYAGSDGVAEGEEVTISYLPRTMLVELDTVQRRNILAASWLFICECSACSMLLSPRCPACYEDSARRLEAVVCKAEEGVYPGCEVFCDGCDYQDMQSQLGYFFNCSNCATDYCPTCALRRAEAEREPWGSFDGHWVHKGKLEMGVELITGDTLCWQRGGTSRVTMEEDDSFSTIVEGTSYRAQLVAGELMWDDGDVWERQATVATLPATE